MKKIIGYFLLLWIVPVVFAQSANSNSFVEKMITLPNNVRLNYIEQGDPSGAPVIFLHGYTDSWHSFESVMPYLPATVHVFAVTQRGHGNSDKPDGDYSPSAFANDIAAFMQALKIKPAIIVGHSMGATVAQRFVLDFPHLAKGIVLAGGMASFPEKKEVIEFNKVVSELSDPIAPDFASDFQKSTLANPITEASLNTYINESLKVPARVWKAILENLLKVDYTTELKKVNKPTLILWGDRDEYGRRADQDKFLKAISGSTLNIYEGYGHALHWENPKRFAKDIELFINDIEKKSKK